MSDSDVGPHQAKVLSVSDGVAAGTRLMLEERDQDTGQANGLGAQLLQAMSSDGSPEAALPALPVASTRPSDENDRE